MNLKWLMITCMFLTFLLLGSSNTNRKNSQGYIMVEGNKEERPLIKNEDIDLELALEASREVCTEALIQYEEIFNRSFTEEEQKQKRKELLKEMNIRVNELYQRKKQQQDSD